MKIQTIFNSTAIIIILFVSSCNNRNKTDSNLSFEEFQEIKRDSVISMFNYSSGQQFIFIPQDTVLVLPADINIKLKKNSILTIDSSIYKGYVNLNIEFITDSTNQLFSYYVNKWEKSFPDKTELKGILKIEIKDENGKNLILNPNLIHAPSIWINTVVNQVVNDVNNWRQDSLSKNAYYQLVVYNALQNHIRKERNKEGKLSNLSFSSLFLPKEVFESSGWNVGEKIIYRGNSLTKIHAIAIELSRLPGELSDIEDWSRNKYDSFRINIELITDEEDFTPVVLMYKNDITSSLFYSSKRISDKEFKIINTHNSTQLNLLTEKEYAFFAYFIKDEKIYFGKTSPMKLKSITNVSLKMNEMSFDKTISQISKLNKY